MEFSVQTASSLASGKSAWSIVLYILAGFILLIGIYLAVSFFNVVNMIHTFLPPGISNPLIDLLLKPVLQQVGLLALVIFGLLSAALAGLGRLVTSNAKLKRRVAELEAQSRS
jgi:hypothetical protein